MIIRACVAALFLCSLPFVPVVAQTAPQASPAPWPNQRDGDYILKDYRFASGETMAELKIHYTTLGTEKRNTAGEIINGIVLLHGTSGDGKDWLRPTLAGELFGPGQPLDATKYFIILPDGIG